MSKRVVRFLALTMVLTLTAGIRIADADCLKCQYDPNEDRISCLPPFNYGWVNCWQGPGDYDCLENPPAC